MSTSESKYEWDFVLIGLHITFAVFLLLVTFLEHGPPILTADETAALGFLVFFGLGLPILVVAIGTVVLSVLTGKWWLNALAASLVATFVLTTINFWIGILGSLSYFSFAVWALVRRRATWRARDRGATDPRIGVQWAKNAVLAVLISAVFLIAVGLLLFGVRE